MAQIETYIYEDKGVGKPPVFLGRGKFDSMPRVGETIYPNGGMVTRITNWNYENNLSWTGISTIFVTPELEPDEASYKGIMIPKQ